MRRIIQRVATFITSILFAAGGAVLFLPHLAFASPINQSWLQQFAPSQTSVNRAARLTQDTNGNTYIAADVQDQNTSYYSAYVVKYNASGVKQWDVHYSVVNTHVTVGGVIADSSGNVYLLADAGSSYVTLKYNSSGTQQWSAMYSGGRSHLNLAGAPTTMAFDSQGNICEVGSSASGELLLKYDTSGSQLWAASFGASGDDGIALAVDASDNLYAVGNANSGTTQDVAIAKYDTSGNQTWYQTYDSGSADSVSAMSLDGSNNVYAVGLTESQSGSGKPQAYLTLKYNSLGSQQWTQTYGVTSYYNSANAVKIDSSGNVYVTGASNGSSIVMATVKYNSSGSQQWANRFSGVAQSQGDALVLDANDNVYVGGMAYANATTNDDYLLVRYSPSGSQIWQQTFDNGGIDILRDMSVDSARNVVATGYSCDTNWSNCTLSTLDYTQSPDTPTGLQAAASPTQNPSFTWNAVSGATSYNVYRGGTLIASPTSPAYTDNSSPEGGIRYTVSAVGSGGESNQTAMVKVTVDHTAPTITKVQSPSANGAGWNNSNVTVSFSCADTLAGVQSCSSPTTFSTDGASQQVTGTAVDKAGNSATTTATVNVDKTLPTASGASMSNTVIVAGVGGAVTLSASAGDATSGVVGGEYFIDTDPGAGNGGTMTYSSGSLSGSANIGLLSLPLGSHTMYMRSVDAAGNWSTTTSVTFTTIL